MTASEFPLAQPWEVFAINYAEADGFPTSKIEIGADLHQSLFPMAYYIWLLRRGEEVLVVDFSSNVKSGAVPGRRFMLSPEEDLRKLDVAPQPVKILISTHLHYDHIGNTSLFTNAVLHVQDAEVDFATGSQMLHALFRDTYQIEDIIEFVQLIYAGHICFHDGDAGIAPGVSVHKASGHTPEVQFVRVWTRPGWLVLASDSCYYSFLRKHEQLYPIVYDPADLIETYARLRHLTSSDDLVIPEHDLDVLRLFPAANNDLFSFAVRPD